MIDLTDKVLEQMARVVREISDLQKAQADLIAELSKRVMRLERRIYANECQRYSDN